MKQYNRVSVVLSIVGAAALLLSFALPVVLGIFADAAGGTVGVIGGAGIPTFVFLYRQYGWYLLSILGIALLAVALVFGRRGGK